MKQRTSLTI